LGNMRTLATSSADFIDKFARLADRIAVFGVAVHSANLRWGSCGSWTLVAVARHEAVRFTYDGRDSFITVEASPAVNHSYPNDWKELLVKGIDNRQDEALAFVEELLRKRFAN